VNTAPAAFRRLFLLLGAATLLLGLVVSLHDAQAAQPRQASSTAVSSAPTDIVYEHVCAPNETVSVRLRGIVTPHGQAVTWFFEYGTTTNYGHRTVRTRLRASTAAAHVAVRLKRKQVPFHYRLVAVSSHNTAFGGDETLPTTTTACTTNPLPSG
jgi:hypothetical protein